ncbi:unnamed protein product [Heterosigma akashiwo]
MKAFLAIFLALAVSCVSAFTLRMAHTIEGRQVAGPLTPVSNFILVKNKAAKSSTAGGIILPDQSQEKPTEGTAVACGPGRVHEETGAEIPMPIKEGDSVIYGKFDGTKIEYDGADHTLIRDNDVLVVYSGEDVTLDNLRLIRDQVLVKLEKKEETTASGIMIAQTAQSQQKRPSFGKVVAFGEGRVANNGQLCPMPIAVGETVKYRDYAGSELKIGGEEYLVIKVVDILAKWNAEE